MELIPTTTAHWHILLNHFPSVGTVFALALLCASIYRKSEDFHRAGLVTFVVMALITIPTYVTGAATRWAIQNNEGISRELITAHMDAALFAFALILITGCLSWYALWQYRRFGKPYAWNSATVLVLGFITLFAMARTGSIGGTINHPEIRTGEAVMVEGIGRTASIGEWIIDGASIWPAMEAAHFIGMAMIYGTLLLVTLRMFGLGKAVPYAAFHRLMPIGVMGLIINVVTGMLFFVADSGRYTAMTNSFYPKMALLALGGVGVLYFTISDKPWNLKEGDAAPLTPKIIAAATVVMWSVVIIYGRLLPYLEGG
jgi:uncharacterized membrane protein